METSLLFLGFVSKQMASLFKLLSQSCGLTLNEAISYLGTNPETTKSWWVGRRTPPEKVLEKLTDLAVNQDVAAQGLLLKLEALSSSKEGRITLKYDRSDSKAQKLGWPSANAYIAVIRRAVEKMKPEHAIRLVLVTDDSVGV